MHTENRLPPHKQAVKVVFEVNKSTKLCITMKGKKVYIDRKIPRG